MAGTPGRRRTLRWVALMGLVGAGAWAVRFRRGDAELLRQWPAPDPAAPGAGGVITGFGATSAVAVVVEEPVGEAEAADPVATGSGSAAVPDPAVAPAVDEAPGGDVAPVNDVAPVGDEGLVGDGGLAGDEGLVGDEALVSDAASVSDAAPAGEGGLVSDGALVSEGAPVSDVTPVSDQALISDVTPVVGEAPVDVPVRSLISPPEPAPLPSDVGGEALFAPSTPAPAAAVPTTADPAAATAVPAAAAPTAAAGPRPTPSPRRRIPERVRDYGPGSAPPRPDGSAPGPEYTIKGNADSMLFHRPESPYYTRTKAEVWFQTATDARAAGFTEWLPKDRRPE